MLPEGRGQCSSVLALGGWSSNPLPSMGLEDGAWLL